MKKIFVILIFLIITNVYISNAVIRAYSPTGWESSNGLSFMIGKAVNVTPTGNGFRFYCVGIEGTCYFIRGNYLTIYNSINEPFKNDQGGTEVVVLPK